ncbi:MAG: penicillin-insensitive murein endopeptidase [Deltaproteobacteria bacterium]|nr:penicillin-insensitive murein endopeptidase [Deltaproteobacteria bacterium]
MTSSSRALRRGLASLFLGLAAHALTGCAHLLPGAASPEGGSRGKPSTGWLAHGVRLPDRGPGFEALRTESEGGLHFGTDRVVGMVRRSARAMMRDRVAVPLKVGDLSGLRGGHVTRHHSHRNGRDVDLLFFTRDAASGRPVIAPGFIRYNRTGDSVGLATPLRFDAERNWRLVEALLQDPHAGVIRVFCASWIKAMLLDHARRIGAPGWLVERADLVLAQPGDSAPHDDHFHVRVACTPGERVLGCQDGGPLWPWLDKDWEKADATPMDDDALLALMEAIPPGFEHGPPDGISPSSAAPGKPDASYCARPAVELVCR